MNKTKYFIKEWLMPVLIALIIVLFLNKFVFMLVTVPTGSMEETIIPGDRLYVNELFNADNAKRGDILVFMSQELDNKRLVKRLIGLPGEKVEIKRDGSIYVDGEKIEEPYAVQWQGEEKTFVVPKDSYFFLGDNRPISYDARYWNTPFISKDKIIGQVLFRFFPINRIGKVQ
ncbi:MAG: signal peptidase I [Tissierellia bacterium]|nr:signal peptidase I [Tissierellia bacterium]